MILGTGKKKKKKACLEKGTFILGLKEFPHVIV